MPWELEVAPRAGRDLVTLAARDRDAVRAALDRLRDDPGMADLAKLSGRPNEWRLRVGRLRVILELDNASGTIRALRVLPRGRAYR